MLALVNDQAEPIFRSVDKHGRIGATRFAVPSLVRAPRRTRGHRPDRPAPVPSRDHHGCRLGTPHRWRACARAAGLAWSGCRLSRGGERVVRTAATSRPRASPMSMSTASRPGRTPTCPGGARAVSGRRYSSRFKRWWTGIGWVTTACA